MACPLVALGAAEPGVGTGPGASAGAGAGAGAGADGGDDPSGVTPPGEILAGEALPGNNMVDVSKSRADGGKTTVEVAKAVCGVHHKTASHNDADCRVEDHKVGGNALVAATRTQCVKGV